MEFIKLLLAERNTVMQYELCFMALMLIAPAIIIKDKKKLSIVWGALFMFFIYIHRILLPFLISGLYFFLIAGILCAAVCLTPKAFLKPAKSFTIKLSRYIEDGMLPFTVVIILILLIQLCRLNISLDYDSLRYGLRSDVLLTDNGIAGFFESMGLVNVVYTYPKGFELLTLPLSFTNTYGYVLCFNVWILIAVIMVTGDITAEAFGTTAAPLSPDTYSTVNNSAADSSRASGIFSFGPVLASASAALVPGITNMAITAKPDLATLLCQLVFILCVVIYINKRDASLTGIGTGALVLSYSFKPTALVFSSLLGATALAYIIYRRIRLRINPRGIRALVISSAFTAVITLRTLLITGQPFTSIFTGLFAKLGFTLKYPFAGRGIPVQGSESGTLDNIQFFLSRIVHFFFCPVGEDMEHVQMAWGGLLFVILLFASLILINSTLGHLDALRRLDQIRYRDAAYPLADEDTDSPGHAPYESGPQESSGRPAIIKASEYSGAGQEGPYAAGFCLASLITTLIMSLVSLWLLYQVDGNYFELLYALAVICGITALITRLAYEKSDLGRGTLKLLDGGRTVIPGVISVVMIYFTAFTGWAGANGFTPADFINKGYYDHTAVHTDYQADYMIKNPLNWDRHTRVLAFAYEPDCYRLKGRVESWVDLDGSGGNNMITDTKYALFKEYISWADIDYIYADTVFLNDDTDERHKRAKTLFGWLIEDGVFEDIVLEPYSSSLLYCRIDKERAKVPWEEPLSKEQEQRIGEQLNYLGSIITFDE